MTRSDDTVWVQVDRGGTGRADRYESDQVCQQTDRQRACKSKSRYDVESFSGVVCRYRDESGAVWSGAWDHGCADDEFYRIAVSSVIGDWFVASGELGALCIRCADLAVPSVQVR